MSNITFVSSMNVRSFDGARIKTGNTVHLLVSKKNLISHSKNLFNY